MEFEGDNRRQFLEWIDELSRNHGTPTFKQLKFIAEIEENTGETFRGFTKEAATKFISAYVDERNNVTKRNNLDAWCGDYIANE